MDRRFELAVVGAGLRGLQAALRAAAEGRDMLLLDAAPRPGGDVATVRSNGFACELGPFAFTPGELTPLLQLLRRPPACSPCLPTARSGWLFDGERRHELAVDPEPLSFATGNEELVQACRRELEGRLLLGRAVAKVTPTDGGDYALTLDGEVPTDVHAREVLLALPADAAGMLLAAVEPALAQVAKRVERSPRAFAWFGGDADPAIAGYGMLPGDGVGTNVAELIFCTEVFARRALPGRSLVRAELAAAPADVDDDTLLALAEQELRRWTGASRSFGFTKLHRFTKPVVDGAHVECVARLRELCARLPRLHVAR